LTQLPLFFSARYITNAYSRSLDAIGT
jgi:hypothetical protein